MYNNRILVIDDEQSIREVFTDVLTGRVSRQEGSLGTLGRLLKKTENGEETKTPQRQFSVDTASQGEEGVAVLQQALAADTPYSVVFVDMRMPPGWNGTRTIKEIRRLDPLAQIVIVTAYSDTSISDVVREVGFTDHLLYLKKPFDDEEILQLADSLSMRWNLEQKVRSFLKILEGIFSSLADLDLTGSDEHLKPFLEKILQQLADFLDTDDIFLAKIVDEQIDFKVGLGKFTNGLTAQPAFLQIVKKVLDDERVEDIFRLDQYVVMPIMLRSCKNVVVGVLHDRRIEGIDRLLEVLASNAAKILDQGARVFTLCNEVDELRKRERELRDRLRQLEADRG